MPTLQRAIRPRPPGLGLVTFLSLVSLTSVAAPLPEAAPPATAPTPTAPAPTVIPPPPAAPLPEAASRRHLRYAERETASPRSAMPNVVPM